MGCRALDVRTGQFLAGLVGLRLLVSCACRGKSGEWYCQHVRSELRVPPAVGNDPAPRSRAGAAGLFAAAALRSEPNCNCEDSITMSQSLNCFRRQLHEAPGFHRRLCLWTRSSMAQLTTLCRQTLASDAQPKNLMPAIPSHSGEPVSRRAA